MKEFRFQLRTSRFLKGVALTLIMLLAGMSVAGCSQAEKGFYNLQKEMANLDIYETEGSIAIQINQLPADQAEAAQLEILQKILDNYYLIYKAKANMNENTMISTFSIKEKTTGVQKELVTLIVKDGTYYVKVQDMINFLKTFDDQELNQKMERVFGDAEYISLNPQEVALVFGLPDGPLATGSLKSSRQINQIWQGLFDKLVVETYAGYETGNVSQVGNKYTLSLDAYQLLDLIESFLVYSIEHMEQIGPVLKIFVSGLSDAQMKELGLDPNTKLQTVLMIDGLISEIAADREGYLAKTLETVEELEGDIAIFNGTKLTSTVEKTGANTYKANIQFQLKMADGAPDQAIDLTVVENDTIKADQAFTVTVPTAGVVPYTELDKKLSRTMVINVDSNEFILDKGFVNKKYPTNIRMIDDRTYLPMRQIAEALGETVGWDEANARAYVERNGERINMTGLIINDRTYVKVRDFEKLGYEIGWDEATHQVTICN